MEFEEVYSEYFRHVYRYLCSLTENGDLAEELTQETFMKAMKAIDRYDGKKTVLAWLFTIARNTYYSCLRRSKRFSPEPVDENLLVSDENPAEQILLDETVADIQKFIHGMKEPYKEVFTLRVYGELDYDRIGMLFGKSGGWARVTYCRAKKMIIEYVRSIENE